MGRPIQMCSNHCLHYIDFPHEKCKVNCSIFNAMFFKKCFSYKTWKSKEMRDKVGIKYEEDRGSISRSKEE